MTATMDKKARKRPPKKQAEKELQKEKMAENTNAPDAGGAVATFGEIIGWELPPGLTVPFSVLVQALRDSGLDETAVRERVPRHAFARACRNLAAERVIRQVREDDAWLTFQFTKETTTEDADAPLRYDREALLRLKKDTGDIESDLPELSGLAKELLDKHLVTYTTGDVTQALQRLFDHESGLPGTALFSFKRGSGVYFVPQDLAGFLENIGRFVQAVGGELSRWPIYKGNVQAARSVREAMAQGLQQLVAEYEAAVADFGADTRDHTLERRAQMIELARFKVEAYAEYLEDRKQELLDGLAKVTEQLKTRVGLIGECRAADAVVACDNCHAPQGVTEGAARHTCTACKQEFPVEW